MEPLRRSARLRIRDPSDGGEELQPPSLDSVKKEATRCHCASVSRSDAKTKAPCRKIDETSDASTMLEDGNEPDGVTSGRIDCLGRPREQGLRRTHPDLLHVVGIDEAGRGPLAGPVVAAAAIVPTNLRGIVDSKTITDEGRREELYESIVGSPNARWAVAVIDATTIDEINILQATLLGMRMVTEAVLFFDCSGDGAASSFRCVPSACISIEGCYVVRGGTDENGRPCRVSANDRVSADQAYALVDGNRLPTSMPCRAEAIVKGDTKEYSIAAASILAKVTRDRLMRSYSDLYPEYRLSQHKGYPTAAHVSAVRRHGPCPIHRRTFAPIKHMEIGSQAPSVVSASSTTSSSRSTTTTTTTTSSSSSSSSSSSKRGGAKAKIRSGGGGGDSGGRGKRRRRRTSSDAS